MDIFFCDICCSRVSDQHLKRGMGVKKADVVVCSTCIEKGLGNELLGAGSTPEPMQQMLVEESDVLDADVLDLGDHAVAELEDEEASVQSAPAQQEEALADDGLAEDEAEQEPLEKADEEYVAQDAQDAHSEAEDDSSVEQTSASEIEFDAPADVLEVVDNLEDVTDDNIGEGNFEDDIELEIDDGSDQLDGVDLEDAGLQEDAAQEVPSTRKKSSRRRSTSKSRKKSSTQRKSTGPKTTTKKSSRKSTTDKKGTSRKQSTRKTAKTKPMHSAKSNKNVFMISAVSLSVLVLIFVIIMLSSGPADPVASPGDPAAFSQAIKSANSMAKKGIGGDDLTVCREAMDRIKNLQMNILPVFRDEQASKGMSEDDMARWLKQHKYNDLIGHTRRALSDHIIMLEGRQ